MPVTTAGIIISDAYWYFITIDIFFVNVLCTKAGDFALFLDLHLSGDAILTSIDTVHVGLQAHRIIYNPTSTEPFLWSMSFVLGL